MEHSIRYSNIITEYTMDPVRFSIYKSTDRLQCYNNNCPHNRLINKGDRVVSRYTKKGYILYHKSCAIILGVI